MQYVEFRQKVMLDVLEIIENRHCSKFEILGYKYLGIKVILHYHDCNEVLEYKLLGEENDELVKTSYYTADFKGDDRLKQLIDFKNNWYKNKIEEGKVEKVHSFK